MENLNKLLLKIAENPRLFKANEIVLILGLTSTQIKNLKKYALENQLITQSKQEYFLTEDGKKYIKKNPIKIWTDENFPLRPNINVELLKEDKFMPNMTKAIRNLAKNILEHQELKAYSLETAILKDLERCDNLFKEIENKVLDGKRNSLLSLFEKYQEKGITWEQGVRHLPPPTTLQNAEQSSPSQTGPQKKQRRLPHGSAEQQFRFPLLSRSMISSSTHLRSVRPSLPPSSKQAALSWIWSIRIPPSLKQPARLVRKPSAERPC